jgi:hypothetical protein
MASLAPNQAVTPRRVADPTVGKETEPPKQASSPKRDFLPSLTLGVLRSRGLRSYATPCHARGASL